MIQIRNIFNESLICEESLDNIKQLVEKNKAKLESANLWGANLRGAYLWGADETKKEIVSFKSIIGVGEFKRELQCFLLKDSSFYFNAGCFSGYEDELIKEVKKKYGNNCEYIEAIEFLKNLCKKYNN